MSKKHRKPIKIMIMRHAEKPGKDGEPFGVTQNGKRSKESLEVRGWQRAGALANLFAPTNRRFQHPSLARPQFLFASKPLKRKGSRRSIETLKPLADKLGIGVDDSFQRNHVEDMVEEVLRCKGVVLICWQHEYLPEIASHILRNRKTHAPGWPEDRFDMIWVFDLKRSSGEYSFKQVPQKLLNGDSANPIK